MNSIKQILVDSDVFVGLFKKDDAHFPQVKRTFKLLQETNSVFLISNFVFSESITVISQKVGHKEAIEFIQFVKSDRAELKTIRLDEDTEDLALEIFKKQTSKNVSFVDCTNIALYKRENIDAIWSFDTIYKKNGVNTV